MTAIVVKPLSRDRIVIKVSEGYQAVVFKLANGGAEVIVLDNTQTEATRFGVAPPSGTQTLEVTINPLGNVDVEYKDKI